MKKLAYLAAFLTISASLVLAQGDAQQAALAAAQPTATARAAALAEGGGPATEVTAAFEKAIAIDPGQHLGVNRLYEFIPLRQDQQAQRQWWPWLGQGPVSGQHASKAEIRHVGAG